MPVQVLFPVAQAGGQSRVSMRSWLVKKGNQKRLYNGPLANMMSSRFALVKRSAAANATVVATDGLGENPRIVNGVTPETPIPFCILHPSEANTPAVIEKLSPYSVNGEPYPLCPLEWSAELERVQYISDLDDSDLLFDQEEMREWVMRGAANAGFMLYAFMDEMMKGGVAPAHAYDSCETLPGVGADAGPAPDDTGDSAKVPSESTGG